MSQQPGGGNFNPTNPGMNRPRMMSPSHNGGNPMGGGGQPGGAPGGGGNMNMGGGYPQQRMRNFGGQQPGGGMGGGGGMAGSGGGMSGGGGGMMQSNYNPQQQYNNQMRQQQMMQQQQPHVGGGKPQMMNEQQTQDDGNVNEENPSTPNTTSNLNPSMGGSSNPATPQQPQPQQIQQPSQEINTATICRIGQETVQEIVTRIQEVFSYLKTLQPPVGSAVQDRALNTYMKQQRLQEVLKGIVSLFKRLRVCWEKCQENTAGMNEYTRIDSLIPLKDERRDIKSELEKKRGDSYKQALEEHNELVTQITAKNKHIKEIIDQMRNIIWEINTMLDMRK